MKSYMRILGLVAACTAAQTVNAQPIGASTLQDHVSNCIRSGLAENPPAFSKLRVVDSNANPIAITCYDKSARDLFQSVKPRSTEVLFKDDENRERQSRLFGVDPRRGVGSSQCTRFLTESNGSPSDEFVCSIVLNLSADMAAGM